MEHCDEHLQQREKIDNINEKMDSLIGDVKEAIKYFSKIDTTLSQITSLEEALKEYSKTNKELYLKLDQYKEELYDLKLKFQGHDIYITNEKEREKSNRNFRVIVIGGVLVSVIVSILGFSMLMFASHSPVKVTDDTKVEQKR